MNKKRCKWVSILILSFSSFLQQILIAHHDGLFRFAHNKNNYDVYINHNIM